MGLILDSSILIAAERLDRTVYKMLVDMGHSHRDAEVGISVITVAELAHSAARAKTPQRKERRLRFIQELASAVPIYAVTPSIAFRAGFMEGKSQANGIQIPLADLLIGVTALELGFGVGTSNLRHFQLVPGLSITRM